VTRPTSRPSSTTGSMFTLGDCSMSCVGGAGRKK
jgi:hypothetical protein